MQRTGEKKMHCNQTDDYLTLYRWSSFGCWLMMVTTFSSLLPSSHSISSRTLFCVACNIWFVQPHNVAYSSYYYPIFFSPFFFFFCKKTNDDNKHNVTTTYFPSSSSSEFYEHTARPSKTC